MSTGFVLFISLSNINVYRGVSSDRKYEMWCGLDSNRDPVVFSSMEKAVCYMLPHFSADNRHAITLEEFDIIRTMLA